MMLRTLLDKIFNSIQRYWQLYLLFVVSLFLLMRMHWSFRVLAASVFVLAAVLAIVGAIVAVIDAVSGTKEPQFLSHLFDRANAARKRIAALRAEARAIEKKIKELEGLSKKDGMASEKQWGKSLLLLEGYRGELSLRNAKIEFYSHSLKTLTELNSKWRQERRLNELQSGLDKLRSSMVPEEQKFMNELKRELSQEQELLKSYKELSKRLDKSKDLQNALQIRKELERLLN